jgi:hypothetical protein
MRKQRGLSHVGALAILASILGCTTDVSPSDNPESAQLKQVADVPSREKGAKVYLWGSAGHFLRFGLITRVAELRRFLAVLRRTQPRFSATQTAWRSTESGANLSPQNSLLTGKNRGNFLILGTKSSRHRLHSADTTGFTGVATLKRTGNFLEVSGNLDSLIPDGTGPGSSSVGVIAYSQQLLPVCPQFAPNPAEITSQKPTYGE